MLRRRPSGFRHFAVLEYVQEYIASHPKRQGSYNLYFIETQGLINMDIVCGSGIMTLLELDALYPWLESRALRLPILTEVSPVYSQTLQANS